MTMTWWLLPVLLGAWLLLWLITRPKVISVADKSIVLRKWKEVEALMEEGRFREAILEADKALDFVLRKMNLRGEGFAQRFKKAEGVISHSSEVWAAHKVRNQLVHDVDFEISAGRAEAAINAFRRALKQLNAL